MKDEPPSVTWRFILLLSNVFVIAKGTRVNPIRLGEKSIPVCCESMNPEPTNPRTHEPTNPRTQSQ